MSWVLWFVAGAVFLLCNYISFRVGCFLVYRNLREAAERGEAATVCAALEDPTVDWLESGNQTLTLLGKRGRSSLRVCTQGNDLAWINDQTFKDANAARLRASAAIARTYIIQRQLGTLASADQLRKELAR